MENTSSHKIISTNLCAENVTYDVLIKNFREFNYNIKSTLTNTSTELKDYYFNSDMTLLDLLENICVYLNSVITELNKNVN